MSSSKTEPVTTTQITQPQRWNACTLISLGVIQAILSSKSASAIRHSIRRTHDTLQNTYRTLVQEHTEFAAGLLETEAHQRYFNNSLTHGRTFTLIRPAVAEEIIRDLIQNRRSFSEQDIDLFINNNQDVIFRIMELIAPNIVTNWATITEAELNAMASQSEVAEEASLADQLKNTLDTLDNSGITLKHDEGHTISVTKKANTFYCFDSATGLLRTSNSSHAMAESLSETLYASTRQIEVHNFAERLNLTSNTTQELGHIIEKHLTILRQKANELLDRGYQDAYDALGRVITDINGLASVDNINIRTIQVRIELAEQDEVLSTHRGAKDILINFLVALTIIGLIVLWATSENRNSFWYQTNTDTTDKIVSFKTEVNALA